MSGLACPLPLDPFSLCAAILQENCIFADKVKPAEGKVLEA